MEWLIIIGVGIYIYSVLSNKTESRSKQPASENKEPAEWVRSMRKGTSRPKQPVSKNKTDRQINDSSDVDLSDFRITINTTFNRVREPVVSNNRKPAKWIQPGQTVKIKNYEIKGGYFYYGGQLKSTDNYGTEASLIDPTLRINTSTPDYSGNHMGYWPRYCDISPQSRAAYLEWLSSARTNPDCYIGYVFLYFYGLERRLLVDGKHIPSSERKALVNEVRRLKRIYGANCSFNGYANGLLAHVWLLFDRKEQPDASLLTGTRTFTSVFKYLLSKAVAGGIPVSSKLALAWVRSHPDYSLRTPARRCLTEFNLLFKLRYKEKYGQGIVIKPNKTKLQLVYYPASASLRSLPDVKVDLPDPSRLKGPVTKLMQLAESCTDELDAYSRHIGNPAYSKDALSAIAYLPRALIKHVKHAKFEKLKSWLPSGMMNSVGIVSTEELSLHIWENAPVKINKKEAEMLAVIVEKAGYGLAPDIRFHHAKPAIDGSVILFENGHGPNFIPGDEFNHVGTILRLGAMVATIDGRVDDMEVSVLDKLISDDSDLSDTEKKSLHAYLHWRLNTRPDMGGLKNRLQHFNNHEKSAISHILVGVALADGKVEPTEIKQLRKLYTSLGLDEGLVSSDIHNLTSRKLKSSPYGRQEQSDATDVSTPGISLNPDLLDVYKEETEGVKAVLDGIFAEENIEDESEIVTNDVVATPQITGLDVAHTRFYEKLIDKEKWSSEEVNEICKELNLMVDGAIEVINDWAFDNVDAPLIEGGSVFYIDLEVAQEIRDL